MLSMRILVCAPPTTGRLATNSPPNPAGVWLQVQSMRNLDASGGEILQVKKQESPGVSHMLS